MVLSIVLNDIFSPSVPSFHRELICHGGGGTYLSGIFVVGFRNGVATGLRVNLQPLGRKVGSRGGGGGGVPLILSAT